MRIYSAIAPWIHSYFDNVMAKFMINNSALTLSWWGGLCALMTLEAISAGTAVPARFNLAGQVPGERSDEL